MYCLEVCLQQCMLGSLLKHFLNVTVIEWVLWSCRILSTQLIRSPESDFFGDPVGALGWDTQCCSPTRATLVPRFFKNLRNWGHPAQKSRFRWTCWSWSLDKVLCKCTIYYLHRSRESRLSCILNVEIRAVGLKALILSCYRLSISFLCELK